MTRSNCEIDEQRTKELDIPELIVVSGEGDENHFFCRLVPEIELPKCPRCGNLSGRNQGKMHRNFLDAFRRDNDAAVITISLESGRLNNAFQSCQMLLTNETPNAPTKLHSPTKPGSNVGE